MDHGALGTLVIGLDHVRAGDDSIERSRARARRRSNRSVSRTFAAGLRRLANAMDPASARIEVGLES